MKSSSIQATRLAPATQIKSQSWLSFSGRFARAIRRKRLAFRGDNSILRKSSMPGPYQDAKDRFLTGCIEIRGSSSIAPIRERSSSCGRTKGQDMENGPKRPENDSKSASFVKCIVDKAVEKAGEHAGELAGGSVAGATAGAIGTAAAANIAAANVAAANYLAVGAMVSGPGLTSTGIPAGITVTQSAIALFASPASWAVAVSSLNPAFLIGVGIFAGGVLGGATAIYIKKRLFV